MWPIVGADHGMLDAMGSPKSIAFSWQSTWGTPKTTFSTGAVAGKVVLTADHTSITTDLKDVAYVVRLKGPSSKPLATAPG